MGRLEAKLNKKYSKRKYKSVFRKIFIVSMIIITIISIFLIDYRINQVLGEDSKYNLIKYINMLVNKIF